MAFEKKVPLPGSDRHPLAGATNTGATNKSEAVQVTVVLHQESGDQKALVHEFAEHHGLAVVHDNPDGQSVVLSGSVANLEDAFGTTLSNYTVPESGISYRGRTGSVHVPTELEPHIQAILGLDNRPAAKPHFRVHPHATPAGALTPVQVAQLYSFPTGKTGKGQTVAIIELGGGYKTADLTTYFASLGIKKPSVTAVSVSGGTNTPGSDADGEVMLDIEVVGAVAPGAAIAVYFAPNTDAGFYNAIVQAANDKTRKPKVMSISWGQSEDDWTQQSRDAMNSALQSAANLGVTICVASGDNGSSDGATDNKLHVDFPSSSPFVLACGGTKLTGSNGKITAESVWNETTKKEGATGGGVSKYFAKPAYQATAAVPAHPETKFVGRGVPDVAGDADPETGYIVRVDGQQEVIGGTSAVAPLWAGLAALANEGRATPVGFWNTALYKAKAGSFHDITSGNNGYFKAGSKWDACTGLGTPIGSVLAS